MKGHRSTPHRQPSPKAPISILIVEDQEDDYVLTRDLLLDLGQDYFQIEWCQTFESGLTALTTGNFDVCLLDQQLGAHPGLDLLQKLPQDNNTAILMLASAENPDIDKQAMQHGIMGFIIKNEMNPSLIERSIRYALSHRLNQLALQDYALELERKNQELAIAKDDAFAAIRLKAEFLSNMSHETRTPLNGIIGLIHLLQESTLTFDQGETLQAMKDCTDTLLSMINNILDFSRIEEKQLTLQHINFDIRTTIAESISNLTQQAQRKNLDLVSVIHATVPNMVQGDPARLRQIIKTLLNNAIKFSETGEIHIHVTLEEEEHSSFIKLCITDNGIGISQEQQQQLFHPFTQADGSSTRKYQGAGLGLSVAKHLTELMGGTIGADSTVGQGSKFWVRIPFTRPLLDGDKPSPTMFNARDLRIGLICADPENQLMFTRHSRMLDISFESWTTPEQGIESLLEASLHGRAFDVVILDHSIPDIDGFTLAQHIHLQNNLKHLPMLLISEGTPGEATQAQEVGIAAYLTQPFQSWQLLECLRGLVQTSAIDQAEASSQAKTLITKHSLRDTLAKDKTRILLVEDNAVNQKVIIRTLEKLDHRVDIVTSAEEAIAAVHTHSYDLILCDQWLCECDQISRSLLEEALVQSEIPMILMTNAPIPIAEAPPLNKPTVAILCKPVKIKDLAEAITCWSIKNRVTPKCGETLTTASEEVTI